MERRLAARLAVDSEVYGCQGQLASGTRKEPYNSPEEPYITRQRDLQTRVCSPEVCEKGPMTPLKQPYITLQRDLLTRVCSPQIEITVDRRSTPVQQRRQATLKRQGVTGGWQAVKCYFRLLFSSGPHARASLAPLLRYAKGALHCP
jgi:hypothetical protein